LGPRIGDTWSNATYLSDHIRRRPKRAGEPEDGYHMVERPPAEHYKMTTLSECLPNARHFLDGVKALDSAWTARGTYHETHIKVYETHMERFITQLEACQQTS